MEMATAVAGWAKPGVPRLPTALKLLGPNPPTPYNASQRVAAEISTDVERIIHLAER